ncbi:stage III sporulation protein AF [Paenibacillus agaridevorans]|uniref:stage III sporulation protein AF n=1 Tax=Paenibacillus agaridevorans TaxID=171404 RepID=UPI001FE71650|nr:stage III sporulation protein AF [Paenibacillus agaridevorans]
MTWLSDWLRDIIAVILLAVLVELLLPNKAMQRYARLVVGLFILLTILSPLLRLFQEDIGSKLDASIQIWDERKMERNVKMPTLQEIERKAAELSEQRGQETAKLVERTLESGMLAELRKNAGSSIESVDVALVWGEKRGENDVPDIGGITITLRAMQSSEKEEEVPVAEEVEEVQQVSVQVSVEASPEQKEQSGTGYPGTRDEYAEVKGRAATEIRDVIYQGWGVHRDLILIRQRA